MLILQRKVGESLFIGDDIQISVVSVDPSGKVRLAIDAPRSLSILRSELRNAATVNKDASQEEAPPLELMTFLKNISDNQTP